MVHETQAMCDELSDGFVRQARRGRQLLHALVRCDRTRVPEGGEDDGQGDR